MDDKELRGLVFEIVMLAVMLIVVVPVCVKASNSYREQSLAFIEGEGISLDVMPSGDDKVITFYSEYNNSVNVNLVLRINKFIYDYDIYLDGNKYNVRELDCKEDDDYRYYFLGIYDVNKVREVKFRIVNKNTAREEDLIYSFLTKSFY